MNLPEMTARIAKLPRDPRGYPIPWFVAEVNGVRDFRVIDARKLALAVSDRLCMICGERLGGFLAFTFGPMCAVNRVSSEPPSHRDCAIFAAQACPFLTKPRMRRREHDLEALRAAGVDDPAGHGLRRNPGVALVWITRTYKAVRAPGGAGVLFTVGDPIEMFWFKEGRPATTREIMESIETRKSPDFEPARVVQRTPTTQRRDSRGETGLEPLYMQQTDLPFAVAAESPLARHASYLGALDAAPRACAQTRRVLFAIADYGPISDWDLKLRLNLERTTVIARRRPYAKGDDPYVIADGFTPGPTGIKNTAWTLTARGRALVAAWRKAGTCDPDRY